MHSSTYFLGVITSIFLLVGSSSDSADKPAMFVSYGVKSCSEVILIFEQTKPKDGSRMAFINGWIAGFATAINSTIDGPPNFFKGMKDKEISEWIVAWCQNHPNQTIDTAIRRLAVKYKP